MTKQKLTKEQRKELAWKEYLKIVEPAHKEFHKIEKPAHKEYQKKCEEIDNEVEEIIEHNGRKYKLIK